MGQVWKTMLPLAAVVVLMGFIGGALLTAGRDEPPRRAPVEMVTGPATDATGSTGTTTADPSVTPSAPATTTTAPTAPTAPPTTQAPTRDGGVTVISPRPRGDDDDDDDDDGPDDDRDDRDDRDDD